ncbi:MAG: glutamate synthase subunit alpha, partial [Alphaproteobacteria bacterium]|nr:glutamate synthase subunit alpha [Alphaproteobacteria bacterium]
MNAPERHDHQSSVARRMGRPSARGLYDPAREHDSCGVGFVARIDNTPTHDIIEKGLEVLVNLTHRGAVGADPLMGDGAGILVQIPHVFYSRVLPFDLPEPGAYAVAMIFYPDTEKDRDACWARLARVTTAEGLEILGTRRPPFDNSALSEGVIASQPIIEQVFFVRPPGLDIEAFERKLLIVRKVIANEIYREMPEMSGDNGFYIVSMSARTVVYKGMFLAHQLGAFYKDLAEPD